MTSDPKRAKILLICDDPELGSAIVDALEQLDHDVSWEVSAQQADGLLDGNFHFDVMMLDLGLGVDGGTALIDMFREHGEALPALVVLSARPSKVVQAEIGDTITILQKPCTTSQIERALTWAMLPRLAKSFADELE